MSGTSLNVAVEKETGRERVCGEGAHVHAERAAGGQYEQFL
jgi:hypothetical protein